jgi:hydrogenase maturation protease
LVLAWGNRSRGDDALGPLALDALQAWAASPEAAGLGEQIAFLEEHQLQVENALDLAGRRAVLFIDASLRAEPPFAVREVEPRRDLSFTSHALSPEALLEACRMVGVEPPPATLLGIRGEQFELGGELSATAQTHLAAALTWAQAWLHTHAHATAPAAAPSSCAAIPTSA